MKLYQQSILIFGLAIPLLLAAAVFSACFVIRGKITTSLAAKTEQFGQLQQTRRAAQEVERTVGIERENLERWSKQMSQETASVVTATLRKIEERIPDNQFTQTSFERPTAAAGFGTVSAQRSSQIQMSFRGTYRSVQQAFLELETRMPQLQLQDLRISPNPNQPALHNIQVSYTAWEN